MAASMTRCRLRAILKRFAYLKNCRSISTCKTLNHEAGNAEKTTHFGFQTVAEEEKEGKVHEVFKNVADKYDLMNDAMSGGVHRLWKDHFIRRLSPMPGTKLIDVAGGTGDIAFRFLNYVNSLPEDDSDGEFGIKMPPEMTSNVYSSTDNVAADMYSEEVDNQSYVPKRSHVTVCDINQSMLEVGKSRALENGIFTGISWLKGNAECLPIEDNTFDAYTIAFGIRNCTHIDKVVEEAYRVLKPGGRFMCLEFSQVPNELIRKVYDEYSFQVIPVMGQILAADWNSYQYLVESIRQFPNQEDFKQLIQCCGFKAVTYENLTFGVCAIHSGFKL